MLIWIVSRFFLKDVVEGSPDLSLNPVFSLLPTNRRHMLCFPNQLAYFEADLFFFYKPTLNEFCLLCHAQGQF